MKKIIAIALVLMMLIPVTLAVRADEGEATTVAGESIDICFEDILNRIINSCGDSIIESITVKLSNGITITIQRENQYASYEQALKSMIDALNGDDYDIYIEDFKRFADDHQTKYRLLPEIKSLPNNFCR